MWPINPANNELDRLSKFIIFITEAINKKVRHKLCESMDSTEDVIDWYKSINQKQLCKLVMFDIKDFYPSIKKSFLKQSLDFAVKYIKVSD